MRTFTPWWRLALRRSLAHGCAFALAIAVVPAACGEPWASPGDPALRHDVQVLADAGLISAPTLGWPLPWSDIAAGLPEAAESNLTPVQRSAVTRIAQRAAREMRPGSATLDVELAAAYEPDPMRTFEEKPREEGEATLAVHGLGDRFAWKLAGRVVADADDGQAFRPDGSYVAATLGNWVLAEYADTACDFPLAPPEFGCAYTHVIYTTGYRYRGRVQGHPMDADGESIGLGATLLEPGGGRWQTTARNVKVNRAGAAAGHSLSRPGSVTSRSSATSRSHGVTLRFRSATRQLTRRRRTGSWKACGAS